MEERDMIGRRRFLRRASTLVAASAVVQSMQSTSALAATGSTVRDDGMLFAHWFRPAEPDLASLLDTNKAENRLTAMIWQAKGCASTSALHKNVLSDLDVMQKMQTVCHTHVLDKEGEQVFAVPAYGELDAQTLASIQYVRKTPTIIFFGHQYDCSTGLTLELGRLEGTISKADLMGFLGYFSS